MLFKIDTKNIKYESVNKTVLADIPWTEKKFEELVSKNIQDFISSDLMVIFTERSLQEEPDIMALDRNGQLYIFELKRWAGNQEHLLQVLRYGQLFGNSNYDDLNTLYKKYTKFNRDLNNSHKEYFNLEVCLRNDEFNTKQHFLILTNGLDQATINAILYWKKLGLDINALVYWVYKINGEFFIEFNIYSPFREYVYSNETHAFMLNTNYNNDVACHNAMLNEKKAAAYYDPWNYSITKISKNDIVFLYQSGVGIVAYGKADGVINKVPFKGIPEAEYNMHLNDFKILEKPMPASVIRQIFLRVIGRNPNYLMTMVSVDFDIAKELKNEIDTKYV